MIEEVPPVKSLEAASHAVQHELLVPVMNRLGYLRELTLEFLSFHRAHRVLCNRWKKLARKTSYLKEVAGALEVTPCEFEESCTVAETPFAAARRLCSEFSSSKADWFTWYAVVLDCARRKLFNANKLKISLDTQWDEFGPWEEFLDDWDVLLAEAAKVPRHDPEAIDMSPWLRGCGWVKNDVSVDAGIKTLRETVDLIVKTNRNDMVKLRRQMGKVSEERFLELIRDTMPKYHLKSEVWTEATLFGKECFEASVAIRRMGVTGEAPHLPRVPFAGNECSSTSERRDSNL